MKNSHLALISGIILVLMAIVAGYSIGYAFSEFYTPELIETFKDKILENSELYLNMFIGIVFILLLDLLVSYTLYAYFKNINKNLSLLSGFIRVIYTLIFGIATYYLAKNFSPENSTNEIINNNYESFQSIWNFALIIFGFHLILIGYLIKLHNKIPKFLYYLAVFAGISYILVHLLLLLKPNTNYVNILQMILVVPMAVGELSLAIWFLIKGRKEI